MCGGGGGIFGGLSKIFQGVSSTLFGAPSQRGITFNAPEPTQPAPPAPVRKQDTGAIVVTGSDAVSDRLTEQRRRTRSITQLGGSSGSGLQI